MLCIYNMYLKVYKKYLKIIIKHPLIKNNLIKLQFERLDATITIN